MELMASNWLAIHLILGRQLSTFNNIAQVQIGAKRDGTGRLSRSFTGKIAGLVLNGLKILDLASDGDGRIQIEGDVEIEIKPLRPYDTRQLPSTPTNLRQISASHSTYTIPTTIMDVDCKEKDKCYSYDNSTTSALILSTFLGKKSPSTQTRRQLTTSMTFNNSSRSYEDNRRIGDNVSANSYLCPFTDKNDCRFFLEQFQLSNDADISIQTSPGFTGRSSESQTSSEKIMENSFLLIVTPTYHTSQRLASSTKQMKRDSERTTTNTSPNLASNSEDLTGSSIGIIVGLVIGSVVVISLVTLAVCLYRRRDEGTYKIDENNVGVGASNSKPLVYLNGRSKCKQKSKDVEWYV